ncbi:hypothetical protein GGI25_002464 [Coemansia spiralis]|uniref:OPA3-like protein n=2 Tax=Coemansia TaxID=4863 RepID=A0A9W8G8Y5_9FUNG|nr:optic atrophy 3 protein-domain-containing protein [Coemansia spiralis]KAJ1995422.1 hypothetical protein EDC05_000974 [Coemansia umbellata]KAJ2624749.1 hypothetical protein GGI26_001165 [Coemansia sp. RSA 1358]KAJ2678292.1 hypothetical protein GGI25_002464 [Coemansia spiralis]
MSSFKIASLLFRTLSKPVANALKQQAKSHDVFRSLCINVAQIAHRTEMTWKMNILGYKKEKIRPLNDARAIDAGANFLGEAFIFGVALSLIFAEQMRSRNQAQRRRDAVDDRLEEVEKGMREFQGELHKLQEERSQLKSDIDSLTEEAAGLSTILMHVLGKDMHKHGLERGHEPAKITQEIVDQFTNGEDVDSRLRKAIVESSPSTAKNNVE